MLNTEVPALMLPVFGFTEFVPTIPVPASPSGAHKGIPACKSPVGSRNKAPSLERFPAAFPAFTTFGKTLLISKPKAFTSGKSSNFLQYSGL